jgi:SET domain-containing protein
MKIATNKEELQSALNTFNYNVKEARKQFSNVKQQQTITLDDSF